MATKLPRKLWKRQL